MVGTEHDPSTLPEWRLLRDELAFVAAHRKSEPAAKELLLDWLHGRQIRYRCEKLEYKGFAAGAQRFFWHRANHSRIETDWDSSNATRVGPPFEIGRDDEGDIWPIFRLDQPIISLKMRLIWLHHGEVIARLREVGLLPPAEQLASEPAIEPTLTPATEPVTGKPSAPEPMPPKDWLRAAKRDHPKLSDETAVEWAKRLVEKMKAAKAVGLVDWAWSQETMERRLRDKDEDNDEGYQVGN